MNSHYTSKLYKAQIHVHVDVAAIHDIIICTCNNDNVSCFLNGLFLDCGAIVIVDNHGCDICDSWWHRQLDRCVQLCCVDVLWAYHACIDSDEIHTQRSP